MRRILFTIVLAMTLLAACGGAPSAIAPVPSNDPAPTPLPGIGDEVFAFPLKWKVTSAKLQSGSLIVRYEVENTDNKTAMYGPINEGPSIFYDRQRIRYDSRQCFDNNNVVSTRLAVVEPGIIYKCTDLVTMFSEKTPPEERKKIQFGVDSPKVGTTYINLNL